MQALIGRKLGMAQVFDGEGNRVAVTVIEAGPCVVVQRKTKAIDGYEAVQLGFLAQKAHRVTKAALGRFKKAGADPQRILREFKVEEGSELKPGDQVNTSVFEGVAYVDVVGTSKGRGFQGPVKRHRMAGGRMTHGGHSKRRIGAIGQCSFPANVSKGKRMPGQMGNVRVTQQSLRIVDLRNDDNLMLVQGAVPGPTGGILVVRKALKKK